MPIANIVVGLGFGDEGKGLCTDFLCSRYPKKNVLVIRHNGGQQAGHTAVVGDKRHVHSNVGSGALRGYESYISKYCTVWIPSMLNELSILKEKGGTDFINVDYKAALTTPYDIAWNQLKERTNQHGSCGFGVGATAKRQTETPLKIYAGDILLPNVLEHKLKLIKEYYVNQLGSPGAPSMNKNIFNEISFPYLDDFNTAINSKDFSSIHLMNNIPTRNYYIFEGAQGIMLDMEYGIFPHVTYSHTTSKNALELCKELGIDDIKLYYITRTYQTRHGNGPMTSDIPVKLSNNENETNQWNVYQGDFRTAEIDVNQLKYAFAMDPAPIKLKNNATLVVTCVDQHPISPELDNFTNNFKHVLISDGPSVKNVHFLNKK